MANNLSTRRVLVVLSLTAANLTLVWAGVAAFTASETHDYDFNERLGFGRLFRDMVDLPLTDVLEDAGSVYFFPFAVPLMLISLGLAVASFIFGQRVLIWLGLLITLPYGLIGGAAAGSFDGEWAGVGWSVATATTMWMMLLASVAVASLLMVGERPADELVGRENLVVVGK